MRNHHGREQKRVDRYTRQTRLRRRIAAGLCALALVGCGVRVGADRSQVGGGPEQATEQARTRYQATVVAMATANAVNVSFAAGGSGCDCDSSSAK
jgi:hypothetical protein